MTKNSDVYDYYKDQIVSEKRIGTSFSDCLFDWRFPTSLMTIKNDSIEFDIEYSFDGVHVAGRLKKGTDELTGGDFYTYGETNIMRLFMRVAQDEADDFDDEVDIVNYRLFVVRG